MTLQEVGIIVSAAFSGSTLTVMVILGRGIIKAALLADTVDRHQAKIGQIEERLEDIHGEHLPEHERQIAALQNKDARIDDHLKASDRTAQEQALVLHEHTLKIADHELHIRLWEGRKANPPHNP